MKILPVLLSVMTTLILTLSFSKPAPDWGFYAHKTINRMAVYILPPEMLIFFKKHIDFISIHATDPDKRRYVVEGEAVRHYMDIDHWGEHPFENVPSNWHDAYMKYLRITLLNSQGDTLILKDQELPVDSSFMEKLGIEIDRKMFDQFIQKELMDHFHESSFRFFPGQLPWLSVRETVIKEVMFDQHFTEHGIVPYYIKIQFDKLVYAFKLKDSKWILRLATDLGHYVADLHVPLHTTKNYNGQLSGQDGIHAFWESRLPELFGEEDYRYFVGKAQFIPDVEKFAWNTLLESNRLHREVLAIEKKIRGSIPEDRQFSFEIRLNNVVKMPSSELSKAYHDALDGMVERRMQESVLALGSLWLTAWIEAGQPVLDMDPEIRWTAEEIKEMELLDQGYQKGKELGRPCH